MIDLINSNFRKIMNNPRRIFRGLNRLWYRRFFLRPWNTKGLDVFEEDWDNMIILDACRYDIFEEKIDTEEYSCFERKTSRGSSSYEFILANFFDKDLSDTVYLSANGHVFWMEDELDKEATFYDKVMLERGKCEGTFSPRDIIKKVKNMANNYENKKLMIHLMQPHYPFIDSQVESGVSQFWDKVFDGNIDSTDDQLWKGYSNNLDKVWPEVKGLIEELDGKTVVTADHGNMFGERALPFPIKEYGHPQGIYEEELVKVPWLTIKDGESRNIEKEKPVESKGYDEEEVKQQLAELGYGD